MRCLKSVLILLLVYLSQLETEGQDERTALCDIVLQNLYTALFDKCHQGIFSVYKKCILHTQHPSTKCRNCMEVCFSEHVALDTLKVAFMSITGWNFALCSTTCASIQNVTGVWQAHPIGGLRSVIAVSKLQFSHEITCRCCEDPQIKPRYYSHYDDGGWNGFIRLKPLRSESRHPCVCVRSHSAVDKRG